MLVNMKKFIKIGFPILCIAVIGGTFILLNKTTERINRNKLKDDVEDNTIAESQAEKENTEETVINETTNSVTLSQDEVKAQEVKNKSKAIEIVKSLAPAVSNSYCTNEGMAGNKYLVAVRDNTSKEVVIFYAVDIDNETFEIYAK